MVEFLLLLEVIIFLDWAIFCYRKTVKVSEDGEKASFPSIALPAIGFSSSQIGVISVPIAIILIMTRPTFTILNWITFVGVLCILALNPIIYLYWIKIGDYNIFKDKVRATAVANRSAFQNAINGILSLIAFLIIVRPW